MNSHNPPLRTAQMTRILAMGLVIALCACTREPTPPTVAAAPSVVVDVPIRTDFGLPFVEVEISGANGSETGLFMVDTGFDVNIIDAAWATRLGVEIANPEKVLQPGGEIEMGEVPRLDLRIGGVAIPGQSAQSAPIAGLGGIVGLPLRGIIGHALLDDYVVRIRYRDADMQLLPASTDLLVTANSPWQPAAVSIREGEVFLPFSIQQQGAAAKSGEIKLDTGSVGGLGFALNFYEEADLEATAPDFRRSGGIGAGGETEGRVFHIDALRIAGRDYRDVPAGATLAAGGTERRSHAGTVGAPILARQDLVLDYPRERILLGPEYLPGSAVADDMSGLWLVADADNLQQISIHQVLDDSPAAGAGLRAGDRILRINGADVATHGLSAWRSLLQGPAGKAVAITFERDGETAEAEFELSPLFD